MTKFLIIGDLHGKMPKIHFKDFDAIICVGDFCSDNAGKYMFKSISHKFSGQNIEWHDLIGKKKAKDMIIKSLNDGRKVLEKLNSFDVPVFIVPGNWEWTGDPDDEWPFMRKNNYPALFKGLVNICDCYHKRWSIYGIDIIGHGIWAGPEYPQTKEELARFDKKELKQRKKEYLSELAVVDGLFKRSRNPAIFLSHNVPYNTKVDKILHPDSPRYGMHFGSSIARELTLKHHPLVCVGGHMHESYGKCKLGRTVVINAGFGPDKNTLLEITNGKIRKLKFYGGKKHGKIKRHS